METGCAKKSKWGLDEHSRLMKLQSPGMVPRHLYLLKLPRRFQDEPRVRATYLKDEYRSKPELETVQSSLCE